MSLDNMQKETGRQLKENGHYINRADMAVTKELSDPSTASRTGTIYRSYFFDNDVVDGTYLFVIDIPEGVKLIGFTRFTNIEQGSATSEFLVCSGFTADTFNRKGFNFDETLEDESQCTLRQATALSGVQERTPPMPIVSPTTGPLRAPSVQSEQDYLPTFDSTHLPAFRYIFTGGPADFFSIQLTWQEI